MIVNEINVDKILLAFLLNEFYCFIEIASIILECI